jgi:hypothetical protein
MNIGGAFVAGVYGAGILYVRGDTRENGTDPIRHDTLL